MRRILPLLLLLSLVACGGNQPTLVPVQSGSPVPASAAGGGGNLILTSGDDPNTLDPALVADTNSAFMARQIFSGLVTLSNTMEPVPDLAETIDVSPDELIYTFKLRDNVRFADGTPITSEDVRWSLERACDPAINPLVAATYLDDIDGALERIAGSAQTVRGLEVIDPRTIAIHLVQPSAVFLPKLTNPPAFVVDRRAVEGGGDDWFEHANGSGPFMIDVWKRRQHMELVPNPNYSGSGPLLDRITFLLGAEGSNALGLYEQGKIDLAPVGAYSRDRVSSLSDPLHNELVEAPLLQLSYAAFNTSIEPFDDPKVREAFSLLVDRAKLAEVTFNGTVESAWGILPPGMPGADPAALPHPGSDIERARQLLAESSYGGAENLPPIVALTGGGSASWVAAIAKKELNIKIEMRAFDEYGDFLRALSTDTYNMYDLDWVADYPDPQNFLEVLFGQHGPYNYTHNADPEFERLLAAAKAETNADTRGDLYRQAERRLLDAWVVLPMYHSTQSLLIKPYIQGLVLTGRGLNDLNGVSLRR